MLLLFDSVNLFSGPAFKLFVVDVDQFAASTSMGFE